jgi:hypothetical protein
LADLAACVTAYLKPVLYEEPEQERALVRLLGFVDEFTRIVHVDTDEELTQVSVHRVG